MGKWQVKSSAEVLVKIAKRTLLIFVLGYLMYWFPFFKVDINGNFLPFPISQTRILGVLQRIALSYGLAAVIVYYFKPKQNFIIGIALLLMYWLIMYLFGDAGNEYSITGNAGIKFDKWLMGDAHMYHGEGMAFDPEGWLGTIPSIVNVLAGYMVGRFVQQKGNSYEGLTKLLLIGASLLFIAWCWNYSFPINKKLWTSSFVLHTVGLDCLILAGVIYLVDFLQKKTWTPFFEVFGKNPLFIYLLSEVGITLLSLIRIGNIPFPKWLYENLFKLIGPYTGALLFAISWMLICWVVGYVMDKRKLYIRV